MKLKVRSQTGQSKNEQDMPKQFNEPINPNLIKRAVAVIQSNRRQKYGAAPEAGKRASAYLSKRRNSYRSTYGIGQSRTPRKVMSRRGTRLNYVGAFAPQTVGGRRAHPPKSEKNLTKKMKDVSKIKFSAHKLRHTFATLMLEGGCDIYSLSRMMGHSDIKTTAIYLAASAEHLRSQMTKHPLNDLV